MTFLPVIQREVRVAARTPSTYWLRVAGAANGQCSVQTPKQQQVAVEIDTKGLPAGQSYGGKLTVVTNGGVVEVPVRLDLAARPFNKPPFQGARAAREIAERMRSNPKGAVALLESGELAKLIDQDAPFAANDLVERYGAHVLAGVLVMLYFFLFGHKIYKQNPEHQANRIEVVGLFWHFVDLVWIFVFPIFYLL